jgi:hypothetical protein
MKLKLIRKTETKNSTIGELYYEGKFLCYTLEDVGRKVKIFGKTRIWAGVYEITLRTVGLFHNRYTKRFPDIHKGMLHVRRVKGFKYILIHIGNYPKDTHGCILVGMGKGQDMITGSTNAYRKIYPIILGALERGEKVELTIVDDKIEKVEK